MSVVIKQLCLQLWTNGYVYGVARLSLSMVLAQWV